MSTEMSLALEAFRQWPVADQVEFVYRAWDVIDLASWQPQLTAEQRTELDHRLAEYQADPTNVLSWEEVVSHLKRTR